ncbi:MAG: hypothetical protein ABI488_12870 [Polyangiaceae bacterium]
MSFSLLAVGVEKRRFIWLQGALALLLGLLGVSGCVGQTANVRALREYEREKVTPALVNEHLHELNATLDQINAVVNSTPYRRGDRWVRDLALTEEYANRAKNALKNGPEAELRPTLLKLYSDHVAEALKEAEDLAGHVAAPAVAAIGAALIPETPAFLSPTDTTPPSAPTPTPPEDPLDALYPSVLAALSAVNQALPNMQAVVQAQQQLALQIERDQATLDAAKSSDVPPAQLEQSTSNLKALRQSLEQQRAELKRQLELHIVNDPRAQQVVKEALTVTSVALRLAMEAATMASMIGLEITSFTHPKDLLHAAPELLSQVGKTADEVKEFGRRSKAAVNGLKQLVDTLAKLNQLDPSDLPGFLYRDSLVDELVGFGWDSVHVDAQAGGEAYFYSSLATDEVTNSHGNTYDYTGRTYKLAYHVAPIVLASARLTAKFDIGNLPDALGLKLGLATNRVYKSGGDLQSSSLSSQLGVTGAFSDALDGALFLAGFRARVRIARFTSGTTALINAADGSTAASSPFSFSEKEVHLDYDLVPRDTPILKSATLGFGYFDYTLPRILYELVNVTPDQDSGNYVYNRETPAQAVRTRLYTLGVTLLFEQPATDNLTAFFSLNGSFGLGPMSYYFLRDENKPPDVESNREHISHTTTGVGANTGLGVRWRFAGAAGRVRAHFELAYQAQFLSAFDIDTKKATVVDSGSSDLFHGPTCALGGSF